MNPKTARFLISGIEAFQKDPNLSALNGISKAEFLFLVTQIAGKDNLEEARKTLEQIAQGLISPPTPQHLQKLVSDLESWHQASEAQLPDKIAFVQGKAAALVARLHSTETPQKEGAVFEPKLTPVPRPTRIATSPRVAAVATEKEKPPPPKISPLIAYLSVKTIRKPIFLDVASQLASIPTAPLRFLHHLGAEELEKTHPQESQTLTLFWQLGITSERLKGTLRDFSSQDPKTYTPKHPVVKALTTQTNLLESYERKHPIITSLFSARHRPQNLELLISEMPLPPEKVLGAKVFQINVAPSGFISSLAKVAVGKGIRFTISQAGSKLAKTAFVKTVTAPAKKLAAGILVKLGLTALAAAATGPLGAAITFVLTTVLTKIVGKVLGWIGNRLRAILPKGWGWVGLAVAGGFVVLGAAFPALAIIFFPAAILIGGFGLLLSLAGVAGSFFAGAATTVGGILSAVVSTVGVAPAIVVGIIGAAIGVPAVLTAYTNLTYQSSFLETQPNPFRYISPFPPSALMLRSADLMELFNQAGLSLCVPPAMLLAIARVEAPGVFTYTNEDVEKFSSENWWVGATLSEIRRGYCYDTCAEPGVQCAPGANVMGPMQFEQGTWNGLVSEIKRVLQARFGVSANYTPNRCNLRDAIVGATIKIKANSDTGPAQCSDWIEEQVRWNAAFRYCGSCGTKGCETNPFPDSCSPACGYDYCGNVWALYQQYSR